MTTDTIQITNLGQLTYPPPGENWRERACALARMTNEEKQKIADTMAAELPTGKIAFKMRHPFGGNVVDDQPKYFGHVRPKADLVGVSQFDADDEQEGIESKGGINGKADRKEARRSTKK